MINGQKVPLAQVPAALLGGAQVPCVDVPAPTTPAPAAPAPTNTAPAPAPTAPAAPKPGAGKEQERGGSKKPAAGDNGSGDKKKNAKGKAKSKAKAEIEGGAEDRKGRKGKRKKASKGIRNADGSPTPSNPGFVDALPGPSTASGVPNFVIRKFRVPVFLLPIYQAAGIQYGVRWEILAAINEIETDYGRNLNVSSAGALGLDAVHPLVLADVRRRREQGRQEGPLQPGRRDLRRRPLPQGRRLREGRPPLDLRLQPRRLVRRLGDAARQADLRRARRPRRLAHRPDRRPLPRRRPRPLRRRPPGEGGGQARQARPERRQRRRVQRRPRQHRHLRQAGRAGRGHQRRRDQEDRRLQEARPLRDAPGRVRQPLHLLRPGQHRQVLPRPQGGRGRSQALRPRRQGQRRRRQGPQAHRLRLGRPPAHQGGQATPRPSCARRPTRPASRPTPSPRPTPRPACRSRSACSRTRTCRSRGRTAAWTSCSTPRAARASRPTPTTSRAPSAPTPRTSGCAA